MKRTMLWLLFLIFVVAVSLGFLRSHEQISGLGVYPEVVAFTATPPVVAPGDPVTLSWDTRGTTAVTLKWGPESRPDEPMQGRTGLPPAGTITLNPMENTVYVLRCETVAGVMCMSASTTVHTK
jgi:hypothetical protein